MTLLDVINQRLHASTHNYRRGQFLILMKKYIQEWGIEEETALMKRIETEIAQLEPSYQKYLFFQRMRRFLKEEMK